MAATGELLLTPHRAIAYNARGYPPSAVRADAPKYGQDYAVENLYALLKLVDWPVYPRLRF